jgi:hypothetical protein
MRGQDAAWVERPDTRRRVKPMRKKEIEIERKITEGAQLQENIFLRSGREAGEEDSGSYGHYDDARFTLTEAGKCAKLVRKKDVEFEG